MDLAYSIEYWDQLIRKQNIRKGISMKTCLMIFLVASLAATANAHDPQQGGDLSDLDQIQIAIQSETQRSTTIGLTVESSIARNGPSRRGFAHRR